MDIKKIIYELDLLYEQRLYTEIEAFLLGKIKESREENDHSAVLTLANELMGFYKTSRRYEELIDLCDIVIYIMKDADLEGTVSYATTILNAANACRKAGIVDQALEYYNYVSDIYKNIISEYDMRLASLYNNMSIAYNDKKQYEQAFILFEKALKIVVENEGTEIQEAITNSNMANSLMRMNNLDKALNHIEKALSIFEKTKAQKNFHYAATLSAMGEVQFLKDNYEKALEYFFKALDEIEGTMGYNSYYAVTCNNISLVYDKMGNMELKANYKCIADEVFLSIK